MASCLTDAITRYPFPVALIDCKGVILASSPSWHDIADFDDNFQSKLEQCLNVGSSEFLDNEFKYLCQMTRVDNDNPSETVIWAHLVDITTLDFATRSREAEQVHLKKLQDLSEMAAAMAHEINNPLTVIMAKIAHIRNEMQIDPSRVSAEYLNESLAKIAHHSERIFKIVNGIRSFSRDSRQDAMSLASLKSMIDDALSLVNPTIRDSGVKIELIGFDKELMVPCRPSQLIQVFLNIIKNALDAVKPIPFPLIHIQAVTEGEKYVLRFSDNGPGVSPEHEDKIFAPFFTTKPPGAGTGIGLSVSMRIMHDHHGAIYYDRSRALSCFVVELPVQNNSAATDRKGKSA